MSGGNPDLFPGEQIRCGSQAEINAFELQYHNDANTWKDSWTWFGSDSYVVNCDQY